MLCLAGRETLGRSRSCIYKQWSTLALENSNLLQHVFFSYFYQWICAWRNQCVFQKWQNELPAVLVQSNLNVANTQYFYPFKHWDNCSLAELQHAIIFIIKVSFLARPRCMQCTCAATRHDHTPAKNCLAEMQWFCAVIHPSYQRLQTLHCKPGKTI